MKNQLITAWEIARQEFIKTNLDKNEKVITAFGVSATGVFVTSDYLTYFSSFPSLGKVTGKSPFWIKKTLETMKKDQVLEYLNKAFLKNQLSNNFLRLLEDAVYSNIKLCIWPEEAAFAFQDYDCQLKPAFAIHPPVDTSPLPKEDKYEELHLPKDLSGYDAVYVASEK